MKRIIIGMLSVVFLEVLPGVLFVTLLGALFGALFESLLIMMPGICLAVAGLYVFDVIITAFKKQV
jgi:hypothetical protein